VTEPIRTESEVYDVKPTIIRGAVAGLVGTAVMTGAMFPTKKTGMTPGELTSKEIAENLEKKTGVRDRLPKPAFEASWRCCISGTGPHRGRPTG